MGKSCWNSEGRTLRTLCSLQCFKSQWCSYAIQDVDRPLTFVQIFNSPHKLPDSVIIQRLADYCEVDLPLWNFLWSRMGKWQDDSHQYRVRMKKPIPSYTCFGKNFIQFCYVGQPKMCCLCHFANACHAIMQMPFLMDHHQGNFSWKWTRQHTAFPFHSSFY